MKAAASSPPSLSSPPLIPLSQKQQKKTENIGTEIKSVKKRRMDLPPLKLSTFEPKKSFQLQTDEHDVDDECQKLLPNRLINKPLPSSQSTLSLNKRVTVSSNSSQQLTGKSKKNGFCIRPAILFQRETKERETKVERHHDLRAMLTRMSSLLFIHSFCSLAQRCTFELKLEQIVPLRRRCRSVCVCCFLF